MCTTNIQVDLVPDIGIHVNVVRGDMAEDIRQNYQRKKGTGKMRTIEKNTMVEYMPLPKTKKGLEDKLLKFLKRLNTIEERWLVVNDMWIPANRSPKTRPGLHIAYNLNIGFNEALNGSVYITEPIAEIIEVINQLEGKREDVTYIHNGEFISLEIQIGGTVTIIVIAKLMHKDDAEKKVPGILFGKTFKDLIDRGGEWNPVPTEELVRIKNGNVLEYTKDGFVLMRLVRSLFKLRGRSERSNAPITYSAYSSFEYFDTDSVMGMGGLTFSLFVDYNFMCCIHRYIPVPYPENPGADVQSLWDKLKQSELDLFDEDGADDGLEVVD